MSGKVKYRTNDLVRTIYVDKDCGGNGQLKSGSTFSIVSPHFLIFAED
jgi:hypothetical protein